LLFLPKIVCFFGIFEKNKKLKKKFEVNISTIALAVRVIVPTFYVQISFSCFSAFGFQRTNFLKKPTK